MKFFLYLILFYTYTCSALSNEKKIIIASTTSTYDSGLLTYLNSYFKDKYYIDVQVLSQGTGQAIRTAIDGNVEVLLVHHKESELKFIEEGYGLSRYEIMYNDYVIVGPKYDKNECNSLENKLKEIYLNDDMIFISRGDDSGTHKKELELWNLINLNPSDFKKFKYLNVGQGMGNTLLITNEKFAYTLIDRSTWISFNTKKNLKIICESDPPLFNQYGLILVNPKINKNLNFTAAKLYINWLLSTDGKKLINSYRKNNSQLFFYNYN